MDKLNDLIEKCRPRLTLYSCAEFEGYIETLKCKYELGLTATLDFVKSELKYYTDSRDLFRSHGDKYIRNSYYMYDGWAKAIKLGLSDREIKNT